MPERATELEYLQYFYSAAGECFGPADDEIYDAIKRNFKKWVGKAMPVGYSDPDSPEEE
jgi:hypothetical protein